MTLQDKVLSFQIIIELQLLNNQCGFSFNVELN